MPRISALLLFFVVLISLSGLIVWTTWDPPDSEGDGAARSVDDLGADRSRRLRCNLKRDKAMAARSRNLAVPQAGMPLGRDGIHRFKQHALAPAEALAPLRAGGLWPGVAVQPASHQGEIIGYYLSRVPPDSVAEALGLRTSDVFAAVDGWPLTSFVEVAEAYRALKDDDVWCFEYLRDGEWKLLWLAVPE